MSFRSLEMLSKKKAPWNASTLLYTPPLPPFPFPFPFPSPSPSPPTPPLKTSS